MATSITKLVFVNLVTSLIGFGVVIKLVPIVARQHLNMNIFGYDINKQGLRKGNIRIPEAMGLVAGAVFLAIFAIYGICSHFQDSSTDVNRPRFWSSFFTIGFALSLGYIDDIWNLPWKAKILLPAIPGLVLLLTYTGGTTIVIPKLLQSAFHISQQLDFGWLYYAGIFFITIFCFNSINIFAGINGLEVGQSVVISLAIMAHNILQIRNNVATHQHVFSV